MKNIHKFISVMCFIPIVFSGCGKQKKVNDDNFKNVNQSQFSLDKNQAGMMQGIHYMGVTLAENCFLKKEIIYPSNIEKILVSYIDDLRDDEIRQKLNIGTDIKLPGELIDITAGMNYSKNAAINKLSRSTTYHAYVRLGESKIDTSHENNFTLKPSYDHFFNNDGELIDPYNFIKKCGDEIVTSQVYSSKLMITIKLNFDSIKALKEFNANIGGVLNAFILEGVEIGPTVKLNQLKESTRKQIKLELHGIQIGGQPEEMMKVISTHNSCRLDNLKECNLIFQRLNKYISEDYKQQLDEDDMSTWAIESSKTTSYDKMSILNNKGKYLKFNWTNDIKDSINLSILKSDLSTRISKEYANYSIANSIINNSNLATDEKSALEEIIRKTKKNISVLRNYSALCYFDLKSCLFNKESGFQEYLENYDEYYLKPSIGRLISKIRSDSTPSEGQKNRSSSDFLNLKSVIEDRKFNSVYFKIKTIDNMLMRDKSIRFNLMCNKPWYRGDDPIIIASAFNDYEVTIDTLELNYTRMCSNEEMVYVASPKNMNHPDFIVEVWGKE
ncbi:hypothetical protein ACWNT8_07150 [Pigmentibacter ruber]